MGHDSRATCTKKQLQKVASIPVCENRCIHLLCIGSGPVDGVQSGGATAANDGQQDHGAAAPCASPHHRPAGSPTKKKTHDGRRFGIIKQSGNGLKPLARACLLLWPQVRAHDTSLSEIPPPSCRSSSRSCMKSSTLCVIGCKTPFV